MITTDKAIEILSHMGVEGNNPDEFDACNMGILAIQALDKIRTDIERLHYHPKLDFINTDKVVDMALEIIDKYRTGVSE